MNDTRRPLSVALGLLANNNARNISPQDMRDAMVSFANGHGQISVADTDSGLVTITDQANYFEAESGPTWVFDAARAHLLDMSEGNGRLTYPAGPPAVLHLACTITITTASANQIIHARMAKKGVTDPTSEVIRKVAAGSDIGTTAMHLIANVVAGDYFSIYFRNESSISNLTLEVANLQAVLMPV